MAPYKRYPFQEWSVWEEEIFARTIFMEARGEGWDGMYRTACVLMNRLLHPKKRYGRSIAEVIFDPYDFSCWNTNDHNRIVGVTAKKDQWLALARRIVKYDLWQHGDYVAGATHYVTMGAYRKARPGQWFYQKRPHKIYKNHMFFLEQEADRKENVEETERV